MANPLSRRVRTTLFYALRTAFRLAPMPQSARDRLRQRFLDTHGDWVPEGPKGKATDGPLPRRPYVRSDERAIGYVPYQKGELPDPLPATLVAFYLPQFHTIPENDAWWGKGFTEWRNVTRALPQFEGHYQPKLPGDLGFYDLRNVEVMREQARLAREYGISAFCFYFYWFGGKTLLETPLRNWLNDKSIDLKFCLCWANEKWTRTWDGRGDEILIDQKHSPEDDIAFIEHVAEYMRDPRYLRVEGKPVLVVYRPGLLPSPTATAKRWRTWCERNGLGEIHLAYVQAFDGVDPRSISFDAAIQFPPLRLSYDAAPDRMPTLINPEYLGQFVNWSSMAASFQEQLEAAYRLHPCINPGWDNEARRPGRGRSLLGSSPYHYGRWLSNLIAYRRANQAASPIFINAWNEWAEGAYLEPDLVHGYANLDATRRALIGGENRRHPRVRIVIHAWYLDALDDLIRRIQAWPSAPPLFVTAPEAVFAEVSERLNSSGLAYELLKVENRGRDILPFLQCAAQLARQGVDIVLKLHTKKSIHRANGDNWRKELLDALIEGSLGDEILSAMTTDTTIGLVGPSAHCLETKDFIGANSENIQRVADQAGLTRTADDRFIAGSMFWIRLEALRPLLDCGLRASDFEQERGQVDGTLAHAIERLFLVSVTAAGYKTATTAEVTGIQKVQADTYPYADL